MTTNIEVDETNIKDVINAFEDIVNNLDSFVDETVREIVDEGSTYLNKRYQQSIDDENLGEPVVMYSKIDDGYEIRAVGRGMIYREFGTGDKGERSPHEAKKNFRLNQYNSGGTITNIDLITNKKILQTLHEEGVTTGNFWIYKRGSTRNDNVGQMSDEQKKSRVKVLINHVNEYIVTQGAPAGQEMWDTRNKLIKDIIPKIGKKRGKELREKFENAIKK